MTEITELTLEQDDLLTFGSWTEYEAIIQLCTEHYNHHIITTIIAKCPVKTVNRCWCLQ